MQLANSKTSSIQKCAFCKEWYDPFNAAIKPRDPVAGYWEFDERAVRKCMNKNREMFAYQTCQHYRSKLS